MPINCVICGDVFTGNSDENIHVTHCGHLFHLHCLLEWLQRSKTCPQCRQKTNEKKLIRVYFNLADTNKDDDDPSLLRFRLDSLEYQSKLKESQIKSLEEENSKARKQNVGLRQEIKEANKKAVVCEQAVHSLKNEIVLLRKCCKEFSAVSLENEELKKEIATMKHIQVVMNGTDEDAAAVLNSSSGDSDVGRCILFFKRRVKTLENEHKSVQRQLMEKRKTVNMFKTSMAKAEYELEELRKENKKLKTISSTYTGESCLEEESRRKKIRPSLEDLDAENQRCSSDDHNKRLTDSTKPDVQCSAKLPSTRTTIDNVKTSKSYSTNPRLLDNRQGIMLKYKFLKPKPTLYQPGDDNFHPERYDLPKKISKKPKKKLSPSGTAALKNLNKNPVRKIDSFMDVIDLSNLDHLS